MPKQYIISTHGTYDNKKFVVPRNVTIIFYVRHGEIMSMDDGYNLFELLRQRRITNPVEVKTSYQICENYLLTKDIWQNLIINNVLTTQNVNGVFEITGMEDLPQVHDDIFDNNNQAYLSDFVFLLSRQAESVVFHCLFCRS